MKKIISIFLLALGALQLSACSSLVSMSHKGPLVENNGKRTWGRAIDDGTIESKAKINLRNHSDNLKNSHIRVISHNGIVALLGQVAYADLITEAGTIVKKIRHVKTIENQLKVGAKPTFRQRMQDRVLATTSKRAIIESNQFDIRRIEVFSENNVIYLMGIVTREEASIITNALQPVPNIRKIVKIFEYLN